MKISNNTSFPYPVLGLRDDITPGLTSDPIVIDSDDSDVYNYSFKVTVNFENVTIQSLIDQGLAEFTLEADCNKTFYNHCFRSKSKVIDVKIARRDINERVYFRTYITAIKDIPNYDNPGKHEDFEGFIFNIEPGEILAVFPTISVDTDLRSDILHIAGTYMEIRKDDNATETAYRLNDNKIGIILPTALYKVYQSKIGEQNVQIIHASLAFNALSYALYNLDDMRDKDYLWVRCLLARFNEEERFSPYREKIDKPEIPSLAQALLGNPYERLFNFLETSLTEAEQ